jgi:SpoVK/Ycf46/Vps4 family AAA+-type ATPase
MRLLPPRPRRSFRLAAPHQRKPTTSTTGCVLRDTVVQLKPGCDVSLSEFQIVSQLLRFIEGFQGATNTTIVFATNRLAGLDPALLSRCSSVLHFPLPDAVGRASIWKLYAIACRIPALNTSRAPVLCCNLPGTRSTWKRTTSTCWHALRKGSQAATSRRLQKRWRGNTAPSCCAVTRVLMQQR